MEPRLGVNELCTIVSAKLAASVSQRGSKGRFVEASRPSITLE